MIIFISLLAAIILIIAFLSLRTLSLRKHAQQVPTIEPIDINQDQIAQHLSEVIRFPSISKINITESEMLPFISIRDWIEKTYPLLSTNLDRVVINDYSLLYKWEGTDNSHDPVLFLAHMDVVPVDEETLEEWNGDPFSGKIADGYVWGRGTLDMKNQLVAILDAVESLLERNFSPKRTIYLAFGHDEEIMGAHGAKEIVKYLKSENIKLAAVLDEGGLISQGMIEWVEDPVGLIGITEKGYLTLKLTAQGKPGHSSTPPPQTAIGMIARAIALMDDHPMPARLDFIIPMMRSIGYLLPFHLQFVIANFWLFKPILLKQFSKSAQVNAMIRTTHAATIVDGGIKDNILPAAATATVNCRLLPGDSVQEVIDHFTNVIDDPRVQISIDHKNGGWGASIVSPINTPAYLSLDLVVRQVFNNLTVAPFAFLAATDSRHYAPICNHIYKFSPILISDKDRQSIHGINERVSVTGLGKMVVFFSRLMKVWGEAEF